MPVPLLLDVVEDDFSTFETDGKPIAQSRFTPSRETTVKIQTLDYLLGDKLAAFASRTTGVPYLRKDKSGNAEYSSFLEIEHARTSCKIDDHPKFGGSSGYSERI